jgi:hypothetical protein
MRALFQQLDTAIHNQEGLSIVLPGPFGVGKSTTLLYIGHVARAKGYVVFPMQASYFVNQARPMRSLIQQFWRTWIDAVGENIMKDIFPDNFESINKILWTASLEPDEEQWIVQTFTALVRKLQMYKTKPVVFLIDQCNEFHTNPQCIKMYSDSEWKEATPEENPVGRLFLNWNTFQVNLGGIFWGYNSSALQLMPGVQDSNAELFSRLEPMNRQVFREFVDFLVQQNKLPQECHGDDFFELCGGIPREACAFGIQIKRMYDHGQSNYQQWKDAYWQDRTLLFRTRIRRLLDEELLGPERVKDSVRFASSLFVGEKLTSAPDSWMASCMLVTKDGYQKLFCRAAEKAFMQVFDDSQVVRQAINIFRNDESSRWRSLELAVVYRFRRACGHPIEFSYTDLRGNDKGTLTIRASSIIHGGNSVPRPNSIPRNTLFVCRRNTLVVDFFIHDADGAQILIQFSESCYLDHHALHDPKDQAIRDYSASALDPIPEAQLQYMYLTPSDRLMVKRSKRYRSDVLLVAGADSMKQLFGNLFN